MPSDLNLDDYARLLKFEERRRPSMLRDMPGIDPFHGYGGDSAVPRCRRMIAAMTAAERAQPAPLQPHRRGEIAKSADVAEWEVDLLMSEFLVFRDLVHRCARLTWWQKMRLLLGW
jgi:signal recognition particle GTPase